MICSLTYEVDEVPHWKYEVLWYIWFVYCRTSNPDDNGRFQTLRESPWRI